MTVREDIERRIKEAMNEADTTGNFGRRIMAFAMKSAMERMTKEELEKEIDDAVY